jgi:SAM-dependent methyltransferase
MNYEKIYAYRFRGVPDAQKQAVWKSIARHVQTFMPGAKKILDPCAGRCEFANYVDAPEVWAVDRQAEALAFARPHVKTIVGDVFETPFPGSHFDGAFVSNFLEHLDSPEQAAAFLRILYGALKPGGRLVIMGPNFKYCKSEYFDCIDHKLILTHHSVEELLYSENFAIHKTYPQYLPFSFRERNLPGLGFLASMYLKIPIAWKFMGKQFLVIAEKPLAP